MRNAIVSVVAGLIVTLGSVEAAQTEKFDCSNFGTKEDIHLNIRPDPEVDGQMIVKWGLEKVPATAYYVVRVWPDSRGSGTFLDIPMASGNIQQGKASSGEESFLITHLRAGTSKTTSFPNAQLDIDVWKDRSEYEANRQVATMGQCDPGKRPFTATYREPPTTTSTPNEPEKCECQVRVTAQGVSRAVTVCSSDQDFGKRPRDVVRVTPRRCPTS